MQNKGLVKVFALLFGLVSIYQLSFTFKDNQIEDTAQKIAESKFEDLDKIKIEKDRYLDSLATTTFTEDDKIKHIKVYDIGIADFTYSEVKDRAMNLGLDLKGGVNVILQISVKDILKDLSNNSKDPVFNKALADASVLQKSTQDSYLSSFFEAFNAIKGDAKLASPDIFANKALSEEINFKMSDDQVLTILERKVDESIVSAFEVLRKRIDKFGVTQPNIQRLGNSGRILIELPGVKDIERVKKLLQGTAQLEFWEVFNGQQFGQFFVDADRIIAGLQAPKVEEKESENDKVDDLLGETTTDTLEVENKKPLVSLLRSGGSGPIVATFEAKDKDSVMSYLNNKKVRALLPIEQRYVQFAWGKQDKNSEFVELYALKGNKDSIPPLSGSAISDARQTYSQIGQPAVSMQMNSKGAKIWEELTGKAFEQGSQIAIVLDDIVYSAPGVTSGPISGGRSEITGQFSLNEAVDLANVLRAGKLPAKTDIEQADEIGPSLGQEAIDSGIKSFLVALALILIWMMFYYGKAGIFSDIALLFNILLIFGILSGLGAVLTLPGIAGIVLTIGMSIDANVIIYERIREELTKGKGQKEAIKDGFSNALSSILDANITTGLTALILFIFGTGPIKGFATTLLIGIATSLFTAIFITRLLIDWYINRGGKLDFTTSITKQLFRNINIDFLRKRKIAYVISGVFLFIGLTSLLTAGLDQGIDFVGGRTYQVRFHQKVNSTEIKEVLDETFGSAEVKTIGTANQLKISTKYKVDDNSAEADEEVQSKLFESLKPYLPDGISYKDFLSGSGEKNIGKMRSSKVSPTIADDIKTESLWAVFGSLVVVFLYILLRFKRWQFSLGAVAAVFHDVLIVLGIFSITYKFMPFSMEIDQAFIAAILTVIGYSLNDTVIIFDRIREYYNEYTTWKLDKVINVSLSNTLSRTLNTSLTTLVVLLAMFIFGATSLMGLLFALIIGVIVGTYSSLFIATPIMYDSVKKLEEKEKKEKKKGSKK